MFSLSRFHHYFNTESLLFSDSSGELFPSFDIGDSDMLNISPSSPSPVINPQVVPYTSILNTTLHRSTRIRESHYLTDLHCY